MRRLHRLTLGLLPGPFLGWLATLMFLLVMQFLIRYLPDIAGKGLSAGVVAELIVYNLAYMLVLAVPMSILLASLMVYGKLAETNAYAVMKSAGISLPQLIWPTLLVGLLMTGVMGYFNNVILPEANFRGRNLWQDIRKKKPGFELTAGAFYDGLEGYTILVKEIDPETDTLQDVTVHDYTGGGRTRTIVKARQGRIVPYEGGTRIDLLLYEGEVHRLQPPATSGAAERYEVMGFERYRLELALEDFLFERSDPTEGYRSDRTLRTARLAQLVDSLEVSLADRRVRLRAITADLASDSTLALQQPLTDETSLPQPQAEPSGTSRYIALAGLGSVQQDGVLEQAIRTARSNRMEIDNLKRSVKWEQDRGARYRVEIHKKYSIAVACLIFMLIGAPLGLSIRRGGLGTVGAVALGIFLFYWVTLVQGEKLADRGWLIPWVGMWAANMVMIVIGLAITAYVSFDLRTIRLRRGHLARPRQVEGEVVDVG
ncbi:MAG: LptF/LptG family permease [Bacteroidota bacterium]